MLGQKVPRKETPNGHHVLGKGQIQVASMEASNSEAKEMKRKRVPSGELGGAGVKPMKNHENLVESQTSYLPQKHRIIVNAKFNFVLS